jgi:predicted aldo/keto reductase-like oxidoreductase
LLVYPRPNDFAMNSTDKLQAGTSNDELPRRSLGRTGRNVSILGLGGEGILRTHGETAKAIQVIHRALDLGITYCDTAPAYASSRDYYGAALGERRKQIFLASKTHDRTRDGSLRLLDDSLVRLRTDHLDLWQLHDLRTTEDLDRIFAKGGALEALVRAREEGRARFLGLTGHHDPAILVEAMRRFAFDTVLVALNAADVHRLSFIHTVLAEAVSRGIGVVGMKVCAQGRLLGEGCITMDEAIGYVLSLPGVSTIIVGCGTPNEVEENVRIARQFESFAEDRMRTLETRTCARAAAFTYYKAQ